MPHEVPFITLDNITLRAGGRLAFAGTTWRIHQGEHWAVIGPNGSGKSTLLGAFDGRVPVIGGEVWYHFACNTPEGVTHLLEIRKGAIHAQGPLDMMRRRRSLRWFFHPPAPRAARVNRPRPKAKAGEEVFSVHNATVSYGNAVILDRVTWTVRAGERWALLGPNGSGKSTLLSLILGDNPQAYANDVRIFGRPRGTGESIWDIRKCIGWISPELQWHYPKECTVRETVASGLFDTIGLDKRLRSAQRDAISKWIERFALPPAASLSSLSAGEQRMALLARALVKSPALLLLDEPCQGLDAAHRNAFHRA